MLAFKKEKKKAKSKWIQIIFIFKAYNEIGNAELLSCVRSSLSLGFLKRARRVKVKSWQFP